MCKYLHIKINATIDNCHQSSSQQLAPHPLQYNLQMIKEKIGKNYNTSHPHFKKHL